MSLVETTNELPPAPAGTKERIDALSPQQIELRRNEILSTAKGDYESLSTEMLHELAYIASKLRRTNVGPPKETKQKPQPIKSIGDLI